MRSNPRACRASSMGTDWRSSARQPERFGAPTITRVTCGCCVLQQRLHGRGPIERHGLRPSDSPRRNRSMRRLRCASDSFSNAGFRHRPPSSRHPAHPRGACRPGSAAPTGHPARSPPAPGRSPAVNAASGPRREIARGRLDPVGDAPQRDLAQRHEVGLAEEPLDRVGRIGCEVDLAGPQPRQQVIRRQVDEFHLVGLVEHVVGQGLALLDPCRLHDQVIEALQVNLFFVFFFRWNRQKPL